MSYSPRATDPSYPGPLYFDPSRYWAEKLGLPEIHECYSAVLGDKHAEIEIPLRDGSDKEGISRLYRELVSAYPAIASIAAGSDEQKYDVVLGCTSKLVPSDIDAFLHGMTGVTGFERELRQRIVESNLDFRLEWNVGPETLTLIEAHLGLAEWASIPMDVRIDDAMRLRRELRSSAWQDEYFLWDHTF